MKPHKDEPKGCEIYFSKAEEPEPCKCQGIVLKAYENLVDTGFSKSEAIKIASNVLKHHHPCSTADAHTIVECWIQKIHNLPLH